MTLVAEDDPGLILPERMAILDSEYTALAVLVVPSSWYQVEFQGVKGLAPKFDLHGLIRMRPLLHKCWLWMEYVLDKCEIAEVLERDLIILIGPSISIWRKA